MLRVLSRGVVLQEGRVALVRVYKNQLLQIGLRVDEILNVNVVELANQIIQHEFRDLGIMLFDLA